MPTVSQVEKAEGLLVNSSKEASCPGPPTQTYTLLASETPYTPPAGPTRLPAPTCPSSWSGQSSAADCAQGGGAQPCAAAFRGLPWGPRAFVTSRPPGVGGGVGGEPRAWGSDALDLRGCGQPRPDAGFGKPSSRPRPDAVLGQIPPQTHSARSGGGPVLPASHARGRGEQRPSCGRGWRATLRWWPGAPPGMEPFLRKQLTFLSFFWDKIWPAGAPRLPDPDSDADGADFTARSAEELSVSRGERLHALREEGGYILALRLAGWPSTGLVPITYVAKAAPETLWNQPPRLTVKPPEQDKWEQPHSEFTLRRKLGEGYFGEVWEDLWLDSMPVAVKVIRAADVKVADLAQEIQMLMSLGHERLIRLPAVCSAGERVYVVTELMRKGGLQAFLGSPEGQALSPPPLLTFACQGAEGLSHLEERRIVHRGLAAKHLLVGDDLACKVADFGLARLLKDDVYSRRSSSKSPVKWTAPEAANYRVYSHVWSFRVLLCEGFTYGRRPYQGMSNHETLQQISRGVYALMVGCWRGRPDERPDFATLRGKLGAPPSRDPALTSPLPRRPPRGTVFAVDTPWDA
ncbi:hypothetical protein J1605_013004 [Eschrichtius robustus]|uniref:Protein kinase domain-containing protein n=1 Tax=Eschrichtius robustus TaxID=9764 RepID=A0AB34GJ89_ESCRO|nr:hypothetical protein J1605_013004 [Eschrichtius robustus]